MSAIRFAISMIAMLFLLAAVVPSMAQTDPLQRLVEALPKGGYAERERIILDLAGTGDPRAADVLDALGKGDLYTLKDNGAVGAVGAVVVATGRGNSLETIDPLTGKALGTADKSRLDKIRVNNRLRRAIDSAVGQLTLMGKDPATRLAAAQSMLKTADPAAIKMLDTAIAQEDDARVKIAMEQVRAAALLKSDATLENKIAAIETLVAKGDREALAFLTGARGGASADLLPAIESGIKAIESKLAFWSALQNVWYGLSLGSVLLLAAIGLAITFGVMGVINMAHGEIVMLGAYTTFVVQEVIRNNFPDLFDYSLAIALPLAFLVTGAVGVAIERGIIRWLYGRPLETLLATWGLSLILQQTVRTIFGPNNREVGNPSWMSGAFDLWGLSITWNRLWIVVFALIVFAVLLAVLNRTPLGLQMRAVTQNRRMASSMGIRTPWVDALTFGLGSGIAGVAGVALSQIDNVSPNLGQSYIIDSFMVVVFGGVGNLWGTLVGALTLGVANKFLEPYAGAVLGKILILVFIILFIQRRPRGLFALKGRAVDA